MILDRIRYRGRDDEASWNDGESVALFNTRLSIIDLAGGGQPMRDWRDRYVIVFNGAIYNYKELRVEYESAGARFRTNSDTEVILEGFALKGEKVVHDLNGMFAFAIWDTRERRLFIARDRLGKKPLYWARVGQDFLFASTIDAFRGLKGWNDGVSKAGVVLFSFLGGFPAEATAFASAHALPPASFGWFQGGDARPRISRYWLPNYAAKARGGKGDLLEEYGALLGDAVKLRLRSDVPIALSFSGGTDSGTIAALAKTRFNIDLACYTIDYDTPDEPSEEVKIARDVARKLGLSWTHIPYDYRVDLLDGLPGAYSYFDQPCQQLALVYSKRLYEEMRKHCTVVLSGNGADELFTGYAGDEQIMRFDGTRRWLRQMPDWLYTQIPASRRADWDHIRLNRLSLPEWARGDMMGYVASFTGDVAVIEECRETVHRLAAEYAEAGIDTLLDLVMHRGLVVSAADTNYRLPDITGYAAQVEVRSPFLDHRLVEFAARLPHRYKVGHYGGQQRPKFLPRLFYERYVGSEIAWARKKGMGANLRWDIEMARSSKFRDAIAAAYSSLRRSPLSAEPFEKAYDRYQHDVAADAPVLASAGTMMNGFMLGEWFKLKMPALEAA